MSKVSYFTSLIESEKTNGTNNNNNNYDDIIEEELLFDTNEDNEHDPQPTTNLDLSKPPPDLLLFYETAVADPAPKSNKVSKKTNVELKLVFDRVCVAQLRNVFVDSDFVYDKGTANQQPQNEPKICKACSKQVFLVELIKAEKANWHKNCFRCMECTKQLSVDTYSSHEGRLYCKPHHRKLLQPSIAKEVEEEPLERIAETGVIENIPVELPPDVVRAQEDVDEAPMEIDVRSKFELFENFGKKKDADNPVAPSPVKRTPSVLLDKLHFFEDQKGVPTSELNGELNNSDVENDELQQQSLGIDIDQKRKQFSSLDSSQQQLTGLEQRKQEMLKFRSRLCHGKSNLMKELYEKGFHKEDDEDKEVTVTRDAASKLKEMFESGTCVVQGDDDEEQQTETPEEGEDLKQELQKSRTTSKMLSVFRELEKNQNGTTKGPKKLKEFTPPRDGQRIYPNSDEERSQEEESEENEEEGGQNGEEVDSKDAFLKEVGSLARAKSLRAKFEKWSRDEENEEQQDEDEGRKDFVDLESIESARILRERFEQGLIQQQERVIKKKQQVVRRFV